MFSRDLFAITNALFVCHHFGLLFWQSNRFNSTKYNATFSHINTCFGIVFDHFSASLFNVSFDFNRSANLSDRCFIDGLSNVHMGHTYRYDTHFAHISFISLRLKYDHNLDLCFSGFLLVLRNHGNLSHRGPLNILVLWIALALLSCIWLRSAISMKNWTNAAILVGLHAVYFLSLCFKGNSTYIQRRVLETDVCISLSTSLFTHIVSLNICLFFSYPHT